MRLAGVDGGGDVVDVSSASGDLVLRARGGDHDAFAVLVRDCDERMRSLAYRLLGSQTAMDDALQDAYLKAYSKLATFKDDAVFSTWLYTIVYRSCLDQIRVITRRAEIDLGTVAETNASVTDQTDRHADADSLAQALLELPTDQAAAVLLVDGDGQSYEQAATVLGVQEGTIASRLNRARSTLRRLLDQQTSTDEGSGA